MLEKMIVGAIVGGIVGGIYALANKIVTKRHNNGKYIEKKLKPYVKELKKNLENFSNHKKYQEILSSAISYLYEMKNSNKNYYVKKYGLNTEADKHKKAEPTYYYDMKNASPESITAWTLLALNYFALNIEDCEEIKCYANDQLVNVKDYPKSFNILKLNTK